MIAEEIKEVSENQVKLENRALFEVLMGKRRKL